MKQGEFDDEKKRSRECKKRIRAAVSNVEDIEVRADSVILSGVHWMSYTLRSKDYIIDGRVGMREK